MRIPPKFRIAKSQRLGEFTLRDSRNETSVLDSESRNGSELNEKGGPTSTFPSGPYFFTGKA